jgi:phytoene desaturase
MAHGQTPLASPRTISREWWARVNPVVALAHSFRQTGPLGPSSLERRLPEMFFGESGTVPGVGVPMVLISGKLAASRVAAYLPEPGR